MSQAAEARRLRDSRRDAGSTDMPLLPGQNVRWDRESVPE